VIVVFKEGSTDWHYKPNENTKKNKNHRRMNKKVKKRMTCKKVGCVSPVFFHIKKLER
jgi:hypothetical protein